MRLIGKLDIKPPFVVKPIHFEGLRKIGVPADLAKKYYEEGADEIVYLDVVASLYRREVLYTEVQRAAEGIFIPFAVGGGVRSLDDFSLLFRHGADKVIVNTYALQENPSLIDQAAKVFGSQSVVVSIEAKRIDRDWLCLSDCGRNASGKRIIDWLKEIESRGAGEVIMQSVDQDGTQQGFDIELLAKSVDAIDIPLVAASGAGTLEHILEVAQQVKPSAIAVASVLHYNKLSIADIKAYLRKANVEAIL